MFGHPSEAKLFWCLCLINHNQGTGAVYVFWKKYLSSFYIVFPSYSPTLSILKKVKQKKQIWIKFFAPSSSLKCQANIHLYISICLYLHTLITLGICTCIYKFMHKFILLYLQRKWFLCKYGFLPCHVMESPPLNVNESFTPGTVSVEAFLSPAIICV